MKTFAFATLAAMAMAGADPHPGDTVHFNGYSSTKVAMDLIERQVFNYLATRDNIEFFLGDIRSDFWEMDAYQKDALVESWEQVSREYKQTSRRLIALYTETIKTGDSIDVAAIRATMDAAGVYDTAVAACQEYSDVPQLTTETEESGTLKGSEYMRLLRHLDAAPASGANADLVRRIEGHAETIIGHADTILGETGETDATKADMADGAS